MPDYKTIIDAENVLSEIRNNKIENAAEKFIQLSEETRQKLQSRKEFSLALEKINLQQVSLFYALIMEKGIDINVHLQPYAFMTYCFKCKHPMAFINLINSFMSTEELDVSFGHLLENYEFLHKYSGYKEALFAYFNKDISWDADDLPDDADDDVWLYAIFFHAAILSVKLEFLIEIEEKEIKYQPSIISDLLRDRKFTRSEIGKLYIQYYQLKDKFLKFGIDVDQVMLKIFSIEPIYQYEFEYPPVLQEYLSELVNKQPKPTLPELIASLYIELRVVKQFFPLSESNKNNEASIVTQPEKAYIPSLITFLSKEYRETALNVLINNPGAFPTLFEITVHPDLPNKLKQKLLYLIDYLNSPEYEILRKPALSELVAINKSRNDPNRLFPYNSSHGKAVVPVRTRRNSTA